MPRAPVAGREIRRRSRNGCWNCKARKVKCGEEKPRCSNCERLDEDCDYKIRLSWGGRPLKKKQMLNGEEQTEDESMFLPGAGQFSIHQQFPQPQTFVSPATTSSNAATASKKTPTVRSGRKSGGISSYQTVFSVAEPTVSGPTTPNGQLPDGVVQSSPTNSAPSSQPGSQQLYSWTADMPNSQTTPPPALPSTPATTAFNTDSSYSPTSQYQSQYAVSTTAYIPQIPVTSYPKLAVSSPNLTSPIALATPSNITSPPYISQHQTIISPQHASTSKDFHPSPASVTSPTKRIRTTSSTSPSIASAQLEPVFYREPHTFPVTQMLFDSTGSLNTSYDFIAGPFNAAALAHSAVEYGLDVSPPQTINAHPRRLSVASMLTPPQDAYYGFTGRYTGNYRIADVSQNNLASHEYGVVESTNGVASVGDEDDVEEIPRYDIIRGNNGGFGYRMTAASTYYPTDSIPRGLDPLPALLVENERNREYFNHFLSFTASLLVPHDCSENPFKKILPQMAVATDHLMNLLLAYSASHRARLLNHPEPTERITVFLNGTISALNNSLKDEVESKSDATLATLIMLCSYDIISPTKLISWQQHLNAARDIIISRGETSGIHCRDKVSYFLVRWFAYLDILGSLSGRDNGQPLFSGKYWINDEADESEDTEVDCVLGFTSRCVSILAKIGELARRVDVEKKMWIEEQQQALNGDFSYTIADNWIPTQDIIEEAQKLEEQLEDARHAAEDAHNQFHTEGTLLSPNFNQHKRHRHRPHSHHHFREGNSSDEAENNELLATNDAFHLAASVHLYRRVLNYPTRHPKVQRAVALIVGAMHKVRHNGTAENCLLFPLFTAGCEAIDHMHRNYTLKRMQAVEKIGMTQVTAARRLMERVWKEGVPWVALVDGEFIG